MKAIWNNTIIAESKDTVVIEGNHYFPKESVNTELIEQSQTTSFCPWKGSASYYSLHANGQKNKDAAWYYKTPKAAAKSIANKVAFWKGVEIVE